MLKHFRRIFAVFGGWLWSIFERFNVPFVVIHRHLHLFRRYSRHCQNVVLSYRRFTWNILSSYINTVWPRWFTINVKSPETNAPSEWHYPWWNIRSSFGLKRKFTNYRRQGEVLLNKYISITDWKYLLISCIKHRYYIIMEDFT